MVQHPTENHGSRAEAATAERSGLDEASQRLLLRVAGVGGFALLTGLSAHVAIPLPPDGVPQTLQTLVVVLAALCLGPKLGSASMLLYLLIGVMGASVFAGGEAGFAKILGQSGGFLIGFLLCQPVITAFIRDRHGNVRGWGAMLAGILLGHFVIFGIGVPWLQAVRGFGFERALQGGFYPFIPGMIVKTGLSLMIGLKVAPWAMRKVW